jgi:glutathione S-transferase
MALTFYAGSGSPYAWKVWLALEHKGIPYDLKMLSFDKGDTKSPAFLAVNPRGKVPAIVDDGVAVSESAVIVEYLEDRYPQKPLLPKDAAGRATARRIAAEADNYLAEVVGRLFGLTVYAEKPVATDEITKVQQQALDEIGLLVKALAGDYLVGALSLADFTVFPHLRLLQRIDDRMPGKGIARDRLPPKVAAWARRIEALPYYGKTIPPHWKS